MKAIVIEPNRDLVWREVEIPALKPGEVLVKVHAAAVNRADLMQRDGLYPPPPGCPEWPGLEISGTVADLTPEAEAEGKWKIGDKVCALLGGGGYAEYACVHSSMLMPIPEGISLTDSHRDYIHSTTLRSGFFVDGGYGRSLTACILAVKEHWHFPRC